MYYAFDPTMILLIIGAALTLIAQGMVSSAFNRYSKVGGKRGYTGAEVAEMILRTNGVNNVSVQGIPGKLTDHYDPRSKSVNLSETVYGSTSIAAVAVAAHECGHAIQHNVGYFPLNFRSSLVPLANIGSKLGIPIVILGWMLGLEFPLANGSYFSLAEIGIWIFAIAVLFQFVTLPVEFNASARALRILSQGDMLEKSEMGMARKVLFAAALTYVAAAASSVLQLIRLILLNGNRKGRR